MTTAACALLGRRPGAVPAPAPLRIALQVLVVLLIFSGARAKPQVGGEHSSLNNPVGGGYNDFYAPAQQGQHLQQPQQLQQPFQQQLQFGGGVDTARAGAGGQGAGFPKHFGVFPGFQSQPFARQFAFGAGGGGGGGGLGGGGAYGGDGLGAPHSAGVAPLPGSAPAAAAVDPGTALQPLQHAGGGGGFGGLPQFSGQFSGFSQNFGPVSREHYTDLTGHGAGGADAVKDLNGVGARLAGLSGLQHGSGVGGAGGLGLTGPVVGFYGGGPNAPLSFGNAGAGFGGPPGSFPGFATPGAGGGVGGGGYGAGVFPSAIHGGAGGATSATGGAASAAASPRADRDGPRADGDAPDDNH